MNRYARMTIALLFVALTSALMVGCHGDKTPTIENDGRVSAPIALPR